MAKVKRLSSTPPAPPATGKPSGSSGMHALGRSIINALRGGGDDGSAGDGVMGKEELLKELGRVSWTAEKQARLLESMERLVDGDILVGT